MRQCTGDTEEEKQLIKALVALLPSIPDRNP